MFDLKPISLAAIGEALARAERYRLLNEPEQADSICLDILGVAPENQRAIITLILARTDQSSRASVIASAREFLKRLDGAYERAYYGGIIAERLGRAYWRMANPGCAVDAYECFVEAMACYERAEGLRSAGNDDALLRWNACARTLNAHPELRPRPVEEYEPVLGE